MRNNSESRPGQDGWTGAAGVERAARCRRWVERIRQTRKRMIGASSHSVPRAKEALVQRHLEKSKMRLDKTSETASHQTGRASALSQEEGVVSICSQIWVLL